MFSERLKYYRTRAKLTQQELADALGISRSSLCMYERGKREPDFETLELIADHFNVNMAELLGEEPARDELEEYFEMLRTRPECRVFLDTIRSASREQVEENIRFLDALRKSKNVD